MTVPFVGRGTQAWAGFSVADSPLVHKDPQNFIVQKTFGLKQDVKWNPIPVLTQGMQEPINYRFEGMHSVAGNVVTPLYPEQTMELLKSVFGGVAFSGVTAMKLVLVNDNSSTELKFTINKKSGSEAQITLELTANIAADTATLLGQFNAVVGSVVTATYVDSGDHTLGIILTGSELFTVTAIGNPTPAIADLAMTPASGYTHKFLGQDTVPNVPLAFTFYEDLSSMNLVGCYPTAFDIEIDKGNPVQLSMTFAGMHGFDQKGTATQHKVHGDISGGPLVFPVVTSGATLTVNIDAIPPFTVNLVDGTYNTGDELIEMINEAIAATDAALDSYRRPIFACFLDPSFIYLGNPSPAIVFYTDAKGSSHSFGTINVNGVFPGTTTATDVAGLDVPVKPSESLIQPFIATKVRLFLGGPGGVEIPGVEKLKITVTSGMGLLETIGFFFAHIPVIHKRREVKVQFDMAFTDPTILAKFLANTTISLYVLLETGVAIGSTTDKYKAAIYLNSCKILKTPLPAVTGQEYIKQTVEAQAFADPTYQDIEIDVTNSQANV